MYLRFLNYKNILKEWINKIKMKKSKFIALIIGILIFAYLINKIGLDKIIFTLKNFNPLYLPILLVILLISHFLSGLNLWILTRHLKKISLINCIKYVFFTIFYSVFMPGKLADFLIIYYFKKKNISIGESSAIIFFDKIISLILKSILGILGVLLIFDKFNLILLSLPIIIIFVIILSIIILSSKTSRNLIRKYILRKYSYLFKGFSKKIIEYLKGYKKELFYNFSITVIKIIFETLLIYLLFLAFGLKSNFILILLVFNLLAIANFFISPIGISGGGVREGLGVIIFGLVGIDMAIVLNSYIIKIILIYFINLIIFIKYHNELNLLKKSKFFKNLKKKIKI